MVAHSAVETGCLGFSAFGKHLSSPRTLGQAPQWVTAEASEITCTTRCMCGWLWPTTQWRKHRNCWGIVDLAHRLRAAVRASAVRRDGTWAPRDLSIRPGETPAVTAAGRERAEGKRRFLSIHRGRRGTSPGVQALGDWGGPLGASGPDRCCARPGTPCAVCLAAHKP
jgi:hypothetical protein